MAWSSDQAPVEVGGTTLHELVRGAATTHGESTALVDGPSGMSVTHAELARRVDRIAAWLGAEGFGPGDCLALWAPNVPAWAAFALAGFQAGGTVTGINPIAAEREVAAQLADSRASVLVTIPRLVPAAAALGLPRVVTLGEADEAGAAVPLAEVLATEAPPVRIDVDPGTVALLPYSSGTTGPPKAVMLTHANLVTCTRQLTRSLGVGADAVTLALAPFFHILGFTAELLVPLAAGATVVTQPAFDPTQFLDLLEGHGVTYLAVPPPVASVLARHPDAVGRDLSRLRLLGVGGAPLPADVEATLRARLPRCEVGQGWGLTETSGAICIPRRGRPSPLGSVGRLLPNTELRVVDPRTRADVGPGQNGELWVRGPQVMAGYLGRPDATAEMVDAEGWLRTGDLGHVDLQDNVVIVDRLKDLIKVNAYQVAPAELEGLLAAHPAVADVAVVGRPDDRAGEVPVAFVVPRDPAAFDAESVMAWLGERLAPYKRLAAVRIVDSLPRTPSGKLLRRRLVDTLTPSALTVSRRAPTPRRRSEPVGRTRR